MKTGQTFIASLALVPLFLTGSVVPAHQDASQDPRFTVELAPDPVDEFYGYVFTITNQSRVPISAVIIACGTSPSESGAPRYVYLYEYNAFGMAEIPYLESGNFEVHRPESWGYIQMSCNQDTSVKAILFADGSSFGESEWAEKILHMRAYALQTLAERMSYLQAAKNSGIRKRQLRDELMKLSRQEDTVKCSDPLPCALGDPVSYIALWRDLPPDRDYPADAPVTQALVDDLVEPYLDLRQRLIYSKPRLPGIPQDLNPARAPLPDFTIKIPSGLGADDDSIGNMITLIYTLSAKGQKDKFLHDWFDPPKKPYTLSIEPMIAGHQATGLQVAMYAPGCQIKL
ncbi:MAG TPA: hypothetical protein VLV89_11110, partial [Candidatus Acidoferrum sp.]|nr:hypothetical protein [Candidatus Acidoferrum sp.]